MIVLGLSVLAMTQRLRAQGRQHRQELTAATKAWQEVDLLFNRVVSSEAVSVWIFNGSEIIYANDAAIKSAGYERAEYMTKKSFELVAPEMRELVKERTSIRLSGGEVPSRYEIQAQKKTGELYWIDFTASVIQFRGENCILGTATDVSECKAAESALHENQRALSTLLSNLPGMAYRCHGDAERTMQFASKGIYDLTGYTPAEFLSGEVALGELIHPEDQEQVQQAIASGVSTKRPFCMNYRLRTKAGAEKWIWEQGVAVYDHTDGALLALEGFACDISQHKAAERDLERARKFADHANNAKSEFLACISHEMRTPLSAILGYSELMMLSEENGRIKKNYLPNIRHNINHLSDIIADVLDMAKIEAGDVLVEIQPSSLIDVVTEVNSILEMRATEKHLQLIFEAKLPLPETLHTDPARLRQIVVNIVSNAIKFTEAGEVRVTIEANEKMLRFVVADTGVGIADAERERLFLPFVQADSTLTRKYGGSGLGLALSRRMARALGGDVLLARSVLDQGSTFVIEVARGKSAKMLTSFALHEAAAANDLKITTDLSGMKILLVEDCPDNRILIGQLLKIGGATVDTAVNGEEGCAKAMACPYDLIFMDIQMPVVDGYEATRRLRKSGYKKPIVALTAHALREEKNHCLQLGCDDFLTKPVKYRKLIDFAQRYHV